MLDATLLSRSSGGWRWLPENAVGALRRLGSHRGSCLEEAAITTPIFLPGHIFLQFADVARATPGDENTAFSAP